MKYSQEALSQLHEFTKQGLTLIESVIEYCKSNDIDPEEFFKEADPYIKERLKEDAIRHRMVVLDKQEVILF